MRAKQKAFAYGGLPECRSCPVRSVGVCAGAGATDLPSLARGKTYRSFAPGDRIALAGSELVEVATMLSGLATMSRTQERGTRQIVCLLQPGDLIGQPWRNKVTFDVEALTHVETCAFRADVFEDLLEQVPGMRASMMEKALDDLDAARRWLGVLGHRTARQKLASLLVLLAMRQAAQPPDNGCVVDMMLSREQVADLLSMTFETVSRQIAGLVRDDLIRPLTRRVFEIPDLRALMMASGDDADGGPYQA
ncbi:CRP/FNR family transcriptional regulator, anaerobic regulatory protein [Mameliella alba]|uniref:Crp/Fnr family transcriptional regulator n=1 Tax=Mameliella alba TaxID=561184 RepID=UPI00088F6B05|nr:Crp/Fnr family transcriptional regulator [Mameliella alba]OWV40823.1 Crp/Fnr family transcriptional regulator [Mameliella alba]PTR33743.1 CRP/FNR family transcriptional regulator [Mameliella alba]GGF85254.1 transcriptional activator protein FnrL [Mameliella alba]SDE30191.1 CRP/FNR family transcriptional regulator, anaerobic regulatory protein [Mameliella alba]